MKINIDYWTRLSLRVIAIAAVVILVSFVPEHLHSFFGDTYHIHKERMCNDLSTCYHVGEPHWHWGFRHYIFNVMGVLLVTIQFARTVNFIIKNERNFN